MFFGRQFSILLCEKLDKLGRSFLSHHLQHTQVLKKKFNYQVKIASIVVRPFRDRVKGWGVNLPPLTLESAGTFFLHIFCGYFLPTLYFQLTWSLKPFSTSSPSKYVFISVNSTFTKFSTNAMVWNAWVD